MPLTIEVTREDDGRWIAEVPQLPGVLAYGQTREKAIQRVEALAQQVINGGLKHGELRSILQQAHEQFKMGAGIPSEQFWCEVEARPGKYSHTKRSW